MIFELVQDFGAVLDAMPAEQPRRRILKLLDEAVRRDVHFIDRHPTTLFQCLWNLCWWYDCPEASEHYEYKERKHSAAQPPWLCPGEKLNALMLSWRKSKERRTPTFPWLRSLRPPLLPMSTGSHIILRGHNGQSVYGMCSPQGEHVLSWAEDGVARLWDAARGSLLRTLQLQADAIWDCTFSPDGQIFLGTSSGRVYRFDPALATGCSSSSGHDGAITSIVCSPTGRVASRGADRTIRVWDIGLEKQLACLGISEEFEKYGRVLMRFSADGKRLWYISNGELFCEWPGPHGNPISSMKCPLFGCHSHHCGTSPDGRFVVFGRSCTGYVELWDSHRNKRVMTFQGPVYATNFRLKMPTEFSSDGQTLAMGQGDGTICVWQLKTMAMRVITGHGVDGVASLAFSPDNSQIATGGADGSVRIWRVKDGLEEAYYPGHSHWVTGVSFSPARREVLSSSRDQTLRLWQIQSDATFFLSGHRARVRRVAASSDGRRFATCADDLTVWVWNVETGLAINHWKVNLRPTESKLAFTEDGRRLIHKVGARTILVYDIDSGECVADSSPEGLTSQNPSPRHFHASIATEGASRTIRSADTQQTIAWLPSAPGFALFTNPAGPHLAVVNGSDVSLYVLEGQNDVL